MARPIDANIAMKKIREYMDNFPNAGTKLATCRVILSMLGDENQIPTLTQPNDPLTIEQLREMDEPVWVACKPVEGGNGYWCLCRHGHITTPAGTFFEVGEIPHWVFYRRPPEGGEENG